jgi:hypothetical protein
VSLADTFINVTVEFGFDNVKVRDVVPLSGMLAAPKPLAIVGATGGAITVRLAVLLVAPGPLSVAEIGPVVLFSVPKVFGAFTFTEIRQAEPGPNMPPAKLMDDEPVDAVTVPPHLLVRSLGEATTNPAGRLSANAIPVSDAFAFGLLIVKLSEVVPFCTTWFGWKSLLIVGGAVTFRVADAELPAPPLVELTRLVLFT